MALCYFIGSIPFSVFVSKYILHSDIRDSGSGNIGTSNAYRIFGFFFALIVGLIDLFKGYCALYYIFGSNFPGYSASLPLFFVCLGQIFPFWLKFKGGKGVATFIGSHFFFDFQYALFMGVTWALITKITHLPFVASLFVCAASLFIGDIDLFKILTIVLILFRHKENIVNFISARKNI